MERVFPDTNALFPTSVMDLVFRLTENGLHEVLWSETLLAELEEKIVERGRRTMEQAQRVSGGIRAAFPECEVREEDYEHLVASMSGPDPDDHVITAAAAAGGATVILSSDTKGFPQRDLKPHGLVRRTPDAYLTDLLDQFPEDVIRTVEEQAADKKSPPMTVDDILVALDRSGCKRFVARFREITGRSPRAGEDSTT